MRKELLIAKRIFAGVAAGFVLFIYAAIPSLAKQVNTEDNPNELMDVPYTDSNGDTYYDIMGGWNNDFWAYQPFDAYWHNEGGGIQLAEPQKGRNRVWANQDMYYSGFAYMGNWGQQVTFGVRLYTDDEWKMTRIEENTSGNVVNITYQINAHTGDTVNAWSSSTISGTAYAVTKDGNVRHLMKNDPDYESRWTIEPTNVFAFYTNIHPARQNGKWLDDSESFTWPEAYGDAFLSGLSYTIQPEDDIVYADSLGKVKFDNQYTGVVVNAEINYRYKIINLDNVNGLTESDTTVAKDTEGEDEGTDISWQLVEGEDDYLNDDQDSSTEEEPWIPDIFDYPDYSYDEDEVTKVIFVGGGGAAIAGGTIGAATFGKKGKGKKKDDKEKKQKKDKSSYKMYVYKDFGDTLKRGDEPKYVYARIEETTWDKRVFNNNKLTEKIVVSSPNAALNVSDAGMTANGYKAALVTVPKEGNQNKGTVSFMFAGEGGVYTRNVVFNIVGEKPCIIYPKLADDGVNWLESSQPGIAVLIAGQGGEEKVMFYIKDAVEEPIDIRFGAGSDFEVTYEKVANYKCGYYAVVKNHTQSIEKANGIIADMVTKTITVDAEFKDKSIVHSEFYVELYPDGLSVIPNTKFFKNDIFQVNTEEVTNPRPGEFVLMPSSYDVLVCYRNEATGENIILKNPTVEHEDPDDEGRYKNMFKENFLYRIVNMDVGGFDFYPECSLPMFDEPYAAKMRIMYKGKDGTFFDGYLPINFIGMKPEKPSRVSREVAIKRLKKAIDLFGIGGNQDIKEMVRNTSIYSASQIEFTTKWILLTGISFYQDCSKEYTSFAKMCDRYVVCASAMVKAGDMALEYVLKVKFGSAGETAATFINPLKNMYFEYIGQFYGVGADPETYKAKEFSFWKALNAGATDHLEGMLTGEEKPTGEKLGFVVAAYLMVRFADHYYHGEGSEKGDVYRSLLAAIGDLSLMKFKEWVADLAKRWTGPILTKIQNWFGEMFKKYYGNLAREAAKAAGDKAFENGIRSQIKKGIGYPEYYLAKNAKEIASKMEYETLTKFIDAASENFVNMRSEDVDIALGVVLNYVMGGMEGEGDVETLKASEYVKKMLQNFFVEKWGLEIEGLYETSEEIIGLSSFRLNGGNVIIGFKGYEVEISIAKNISVMIDLIFGYCFSWMEKIYEYCVDDNATAPDARDIMECNTKILDEVVEIVEDPKPIVYRYKN